MDRIERKTIANLLGNSRLGNWLQQTLRYRRAGFGHALVLRGTDEKATRLKNCHMQRFYCKKTIEEDHLKRN